MKILSILGHTAIGVVMMGGALVTAMLSTGHLFVAYDETKNLITKK